MGLTSLVIVTLPINGFRQELRQDLFNRLCNGSKIIGLCTMPRNGLINAQINGGP